MLGSHRQKVSSSLLVAALFLGLTLPAPALQPEPGAVFTRIIDTGAGHASVTVMPGPHYLVFDTGHWNVRSTEIVLDQMRTVVGDHDIDLLVISHTDADHLGATEKLLDAYRVRTILHTGMERDERTDAGNLTTWASSDRAIRRAWYEGRSVDINLKYDDFPPGAGFQFGSTFLTMLSGFSLPPDEWGFTAGGACKSSQLSKCHNAGSIVIRLQFAGRALLFTGDAVGRRDDGPEDDIIAAEAFMVGNAARLPLRSDVLIAAHHGANNSTSTPFLAAVRPTYVIFPAGRGAHRHPRWQTAQRVQLAGVPLEHIFRTDLEDDEGTSEWTHGRLPGHVDPIGDDHVDILIRPTGEVVVEYESARNEALRKGEIEPGDDL